MLNIVFIITAILEIVITCFVVFKLEQIKTKVKILENKMLFNYRIFTRINAKLKKSIENLNKFIGFITNKKFILIKNILSNLYMIYEAYLLFDTLKSFKSSKALKFLSSKNLRNIIIAKTVYQLIRKLA